MAWVAAGWVIWQQAWSVLQYRDLTISCFSPDYMSLDKPLTFWDHHKMKIIISDSYSPSFKIISWEMFGSFKRTLAIKSQGDIHCTYKYGLSPGDQAQNRHMVRSVGEI